MSERLTNVHLGLLEHSLGMIENDYRPTCHSANYGNGCPGATDESIDFWRRAVDSLPAMLAEIRASRAAALSAEDVETLRMVRAEIREFGMVDDESAVDEAPCQRRAIAVLDRLIAAGGGR